MQSLGLGELVSLISRSLPDIGEVRLRPRGKVSGSPTMHEQCGH